MEATRISALNLPPYGCVISGKHCYLSEPKVLICVVISHLKEDSMKSLRCMQYTVAKVNILLLLLEFVCQVCQLGVLSELCKKVENQVFKAGNQPDPGLGNVH